MGSSVADDNNNLKAIFLPFVATSHLIPLVDIARLFAIHGVDVTILATPANAAIFQPSVHRDSAARGRNIRTHIVPFPASQVGLPPGIESFNSNTPKTWSPKSTKLFPFSKMNSNGCSTTFTPIS